PRGPGSAVREPAPRRSGRRRSRNPPARSRLAPNRSFGLDPPFVTYEFAKEGREDPDHHPPSRVAGIHEALDGGPQPGRDRDTSKPGPTKRVSKLRPVNHQGAGEGDPTQGFHQDVALSPLHRFDTMPAEVPNPALPLAVDLDVEVDRHLGPSR